MRAMLPATLPSLALRHSCPPPLHFPSPTEVYALMERGAASRTTGATKLNEISSRSHAIFMLIVEKSTPVEGPPGGAGGEAYSGVAPGGWWRGWGRWEGEVV